ncbi:hypothetical protein OAA80_00840 [Amylibacter sp.]|jgi:hypothetical protein|nr:hypothetical protein [Amylibacter sp.]
MTNNLDKSEFTIVTTFSQDGWDKYAHKFAKTMDKYLPENIEVLLYYEGANHPNGFTGRMKFMNFDIHCGEKQKCFEEVEEPYRISVNPAGANEPEFKFQASRFAHKYHACEHAINKITSRYLVWIDADVITLKNVPRNFFYELVSEGSYWSRIGRGAEYPECGFMIWDRQHEVHKTFWDIMESMYGKGQLFKLSEWHDSYVWWEAEKILQKNLENIAFDLGDGERGHAFVRGILGEYFDHLKGQRKIFGFSPEKKTFIHKLLYFLFFNTAKLLKIIK